MESEGGDVRSIAKSDQVLRDGLGGSESTGNSALIVRRIDEEVTGLDEEFRLRVRLDSTEHEGDDDVDEEEEEEEEEFAFVCENPYGLIISAEDAFEDGQIRPFYPVFGRNIFLEEDASQPGSSSASDSVPRGFLLEEWMRNPSSSSSSDGGDLPGGLAEGTYCVWGQGKPADTEAACKKSNSTGFSKLWRVKDLVARSNSDGKDAFVFLNLRKPKDYAATATATPELEMKPAPKPNSSKAKGKASASASMMTTKKEGRQGGGQGYLARTDKNKRRSYLPYKVGFFTNINGMSRNIHPY